MKLTLTIYFKSPIYFIKFAATKTNEPTIVLDMCYNITIAADLKTCRILRSLTAIYLSRAIISARIPFTFTNLECKKNIVQLLAFLLSNVFGSQNFE